MSKHSKYSELDEILDDYHNARDMAYRVDCPHKPKCNKLGCPNNQTWEKGRAKNIAKANKEALQALTTLITKEKAKAELAGRFDELERCPSGRRRSSYYIERIAQLKKLEAQLTKDTEEVVNSPDDWRGYDKKPIFGPLDMPENTTPKAQLASEETNE